MGFESRFFSFASRRLDLTTTKTVEHSVVIFGQYKILKLLLENSSYRGGWKNKLGKILWTCRVPLISSSDSVHPSLTPKFGFLHGMLWFLPCYSCFSNHLQFSFSEDFLSRDTFCSPRFKILISRNAHLVHQNWYRISFRLLLFLRDLYNCVLVHSEHGLRGPRQTL
jgi:hypothetical protein